MDSGRAPTIAGLITPNGLKPNQCAWANNASFRAGGIQPRGGWEYLATIPTGLALFNCSYMYEPPGEFPKIIAAIGGRFYQINVDTDNSIIDITGANANPPLIDYGYMVQGEQFLVIQAGDGVTEPLVWDSVILRRISAMGGAGPFLPAGFAMDYYMGRIWVANGRQYMAGDIVRGPSGTAPYGLADSILHNTENAYLTSGGVFTVPTMDGNIRALDHPANIDTALGEGQLLPFTRRNIYSTNVTPTRADWVLLREPIQRVAQINFGTTSDRSVVAVNGDLYYQSVDGVRSLTQAIRNFGSGPGNVPISHEVQRATAQNDRALLRFGTGIEFDNRLLESCLPFQTPVGVAHPGLLSLNFDLLNSIGEKLPPAWEGIWQGLNILQVLKGDFGGRQRAFAFVWSEIHQELQLWEITNDAAQDRIKGGDESRITWSFETPSFTWGNPFQLKQLESMEFWVDRLIGKVEFTVEFRPGQYPCWQFWHHWEECASRNTCELPNPLLPCDYPEQPYLPQYRATMVLPTPPKQCNNSVNRPMDIDYQFQFRVTIKGNCRVRGFNVHAIPREKAPFEGIRCTDPGELADVPKRIL